MSSFYTRQGDDGTTGLLGEGRVPKHHPRIEALGTLDEANATLGLARAQARSPRTEAVLLEAQRDLYSMMAEVAATPGNAERFRTVDAARVAWLEAQIASLSETVGAPEGFIVPGDTPAGAALALARTVVRRAERRLSALLEQGEVTNVELLRYLNRLSSLCFVLELLENQIAGKSSTRAKT